MKKISDETKSKKTDEPLKRPYTKPRIEEEEKFDVLAAGCNMPSDRAGCAKPQNTA